jgi:hypothetical protein
MAHCGRVKQSQKSLLERDGKSIMFSHFLL